MYTVFSEAHSKGIRTDLSDRGLSFDGFCFLFDLDGCYLHMTISPTALRYNGAQITGVLDLPECFNTSNITDPMTLNRGTLLEV